MQQVEHPPSLRVLLELALRLQELVPILELYLVVLLQRLMAVVLPPEAQRLAARRLEVEPDFCFYFSVLWETCFYSYF